MRHGTLRRDGSVKLSYAGRPIVLSIRCDGGHETGRRYFPQLHNNPRLCSKTHFGTAATAGNPTRKGPTEGTLRKSTNMREAMQ